MMYEQDYIMRIIKEVIRTLLKLLFHINLESPVVDLLQKVEERDTLNKLLALVDQGEINEAENFIYEIISEGKKERLGMVLFFYSYLNEKTDAFLEEHHYSREEVVQGLECVASQCGLEDVIRHFFDR